MHINPTRRSPRRTAAAGPEPARWAWASDLCPFCRRRVSSARGTAASVSSDPVSGPPPSDGCARSWAARASSSERGPISGPTGVPGWPRSATMRSFAANYLKHRLADSGAFDIPFARHCMHEFIASSATLKRETGVRTLDVAKRLLDKGFHAPTVYFPLTVEEAMLIEPTETESSRRSTHSLTRSSRSRARRSRSPAGDRSAPHHAGPPARRSRRCPAARPALAAGRRERRPLPRLTFGTC